MNDPISLDNLHPIVLPPVQGIWPIAPGWYMIATLLIATAIFFVLRFMQRRRANQYRQDALSQLAVLQKTLDHGEAENALRALPVLIKATALYAYSRKTIASLYGDGWIDFLNETLSAPHFNKEDGVLLAQISYGTPNAILAVSKQQSSQLFGHVKYWIQHHLSVDEQEKRND